MARKPRFNINGIPQHVIQRGNNRELCFFAREDYQFYLECLKDAAKKYHCEVHAYVLMTNHVHLLVTPLKDYAVSQMMQSIGRRYVQYVNHVYRRTGTLWAVPAHPCAHGTCMSYTSQGRFKASLVDEENYLFACMRYIELNPVRANMVESPSEYPWSSYQTNAFGKQNEIIIQHTLYQALGLTELERQMAYRELFRGHLNKEMIHEIRDALNDEQVLGSEYFKDKIEKVVNRSVRKQPVGRPRVSEESAQYWI